MDWNETKKMMPENGQVVLTKIHDEKGERNLQSLKWKNNLWFFPDESMYVYYNPTHWQELKSNKK